MQKRCIMTALVLLACLGVFFTIPHPSHALSGSEWQAGRIIDDSLFFSTNTMTPDEIQLFLNSKVPSCDTNGNQTYSGSTTRAQYGTSKGYPPPYTCLKDYWQGTTEKAAEPGLCGQYNGGNKSASQIIYEVGQICGINPKVLLVLLQKEQSLITDEWPWSSQYRSATGYGCPDTAPCDAQYYGFFNQVYNAARQFKRYERDASSYRYRSNRDNAVQYNPNAGCGVSNVYIQNQATAGLYNYTPYQPNAAALNNLYGSGDGCSAYGNRNFWRLFNDWFGTVNGPAYSWQLTGMEFYTDPGRTNPMSSEITLQPGATAYGRVKARNNGYLPWDPSFIRLGTSNPRDRTSPFRNGSWPYPTRPAQLHETRVEPSQIGTFEFSLTAGQTTGSFREDFNLVAEGSTWLNDIGAFYSVNVVAPGAAPVPSVTTLSSGQQLNAKEHLLAPFSQASLQLEDNGNLILSHDYRSVWQTNVAGRQASYLVMQTDGNLVLYNAANQPIWYTGTGGNPGARLNLQQDGNLVLYSASNTPLWSSQSTHNPSYISYVNTTLYSGKLLKGQWIETANHHYKMVLQNDGNLVVYSPQRAVWSTRTNGLPASYLAMQQDGNLVLYGQNNQPLWHSGTNDRGLSALVMQQDGNLVIYRGMTAATWNTGTGGQ